MVCVSPCNDPDVITGAAGFLAAAGGGTYAVGRLPKSSPVMYDSVNAGRLVESPTLPTPSDSMVGGVEPGANAVVTVCGGNADPDVFEDAVGPSPWAAYDGVDGGWAMSDSRRITETRDVRGFRRVSLDGVGHLVITQGDADSLVIEADRQVMPRITTRVEDDTLTIRLETGRWWQQLGDAAQRIRYDLTMREVAGITLAGAGKVEASGVSSERLDLVVSGAGSLKVSALSATELSTVVSGAGSCDVSGRAESQEVTIKGVGSHRGSGLRSSRAKALVSGSGSITVNVEETLDATVSGAGSIRYHGEPTVFRRITGVGSIRGLGNRPD